MVVAVVGVDPQHAVLFALVVVVGVGPVLLV
jgi:hypothetical protein